MVPTQRAPLWPFVPRVIPTPSSSLQPAWYIVNMLDGSDSEVSVRACTVIRVHQRHSHDDIDKTLARKSGACVVLEVGSRDI